MTQQQAFGGPWTEQKLQILSKYLKAYRMIFAKNATASIFLRPWYVDAFAGTGEIPRPDLDGTTVHLLPEIIEDTEGFKKGSVLRALEIDPPFYKYVFIEKNGRKCEELQALKKKFPKLTIEVVKDDANVALISWCKKLTRVDRAVVFLDPFGASIDWSTVEALGKSKAVDLWFLFPYSAINRMLTKDHMPEDSWKEKLNRVFGTVQWEDEFYSTDSQPLSLFPDLESEVTLKIANAHKIIDFYINRLKDVFPKVPDPGKLYNSKNLQFALIFATHNEAGRRIANDLLRKILD